MFSVYRCKKKLCQNAFHWKPPRSIPHKGTDSENRQNVLPRKMESIKYINYPSLQSDSNSP